MVTGISAQRTCLGSVIHHNWRYLTLSRDVRNRESSWKASLTSLLNRLNRVSSSSTYFSESCSERAHTLTGPTNKLLLVYLCTQVFTHRGDNFSTGAHVVQAALFDVALKVLEHGVYSSRNTVHQSEHQT